MGDRQFCFEIKEVGANLDIEQEVYNLIYLADIFEEFYPNAFSNKEKQEKSIVKILKKSSH